MIKNLFPSQIWKSSLNIESSVKEKIFNSIENNYKKNKDYTMPYWPCNIHSTIIEHNDIDYSDLIPYFKNEYERFANELDLQYHQYNISEIWYNWYSKGSNQEVHDHVIDDIFYSGVYFLKLQKDHPLITFYNYTNYHAIYSSRPNIGGIYSKNNINHSITHIKHDLDVKENDFIIFPSYLPHSVNIQKIDDPRITISMNFTLESKNGPAN
jgi:hypothetical protein